MTRIALTVGDESKDGHGETESLLVDVNRTRKELEKAYKKGARRLKYDFEVQAACEYGKRTLPKAVLARLKALGWKAPEGFEHGGLQRKKRELDPDVYFDIWIFLANLGDPGLEIYVQTPDSVDELPIGGYGLFGDTEDD